MTGKTTSGLKGHKIVSHEEWLKARTEFLAKEQEFTRLRDELSQQRRELPWRSSIADPTAAGRSLRSPSGSGCRDPPFLPSLIAWSVSHRCVT